MHDRGAVWAALLLAGALLVPAAARAQDWHTVTQSRALRGQSLLRVELEYGAGRLEVGAADASQLYRASLRYDADVFEPRLRFYGDRLRIGLEGGRIHGRNLRSGNLDLRLSPSVPLDLDLKFGAGEAQMELGGLRVRSLEVATGASNTMMRFSQPNAESMGTASFGVGAARFEAVGLGNLNARRIEVKGGVGEVVLDFSGEWQQNASAQIEMGLGSLTIRLPRDLGVQLRRGGILTGFDGQGLVKRGDVYYSENWDDASRRLSIDLAAALGSVRVAWVDGSTGGMP